MGVDDRARIALLLPPDEPVTVRGALAVQLAAAVDLGVGVDEARDALAREHYFRTWERAEAAGERVIDRRFEAAADAIVAGEVDELRRLLAADPTLARARSAYGHRQTLLQHVAGNGIEWARQWQTPPMACEIARMLLAAGAEPDALCESYSSTDTAMTLLCSSCHPADAGLQASLVEILIAGGACVDGPDRDSDPLWTATTWGYASAVDALVRCGATIDNIVLAAAAGDVARVRELAAHPPAPCRVGKTGHVLPAEHLRDYALIYAASLDRVDVVAWLLTQDVDLTIREPVFEATALGAARHEHASAGRPHGNPQVIALLDTHGARDDL